MQTITTLEEQARRLNSLEDRLDSIDTIPLLPAAAKHQLKELTGELVETLRFQLVLTQEIANALRAEGLEVFNG